MFNLPFVVKDIKEVMVIKANEIKFIEHVKVIKYKFLSNILPFITLQEEGYFLRIKMFELHGKYRDYDNTK